MIRYAIDHGVNYIDTAYPYINFESEPVVGRALTEGYREKVHLATKLPSWLITSRQDMDAYLEEQLARLKTDSIDFYLLHGLNEPFWENLSALGVTDFLDDAIADKRIRYAGFSFHDKTKVFKKIVKSYDWTFAQIQYNFMDEHYQAGTKELKYAAKKGLGIVVMEPIRGGMLAKELAGIAEIWERADVQHTPAEWALRWVWNHPDVTVVLSGMSIPAQVRQNVDLTKDGLPRYASFCQGCGECEERCPQNLPIRDNLKRVVEYFGK
jgi:predicted aldo/keto reductase-like oxidoreductase